MLLRHLINIASVSSIAKIESKTIDNACPCNPGRYPHPRMAKLPLKQYVKQF
jgi:hypothetical protein